MSETHRPTGSDSRQDEPARPASNGSRATYESLVNYAADSLLIKDYDGYSDLREPSLPGVSRHLLDELSGKTRRGSVSSRHRPSNSRQMTSG